MIRCLLNYNSGGNVTHSSQFFLTFQICALTVSVTNDCMVTSVAKPVYFSQTRESHKKQTKKTKVLKM